jgi:hypothetical protein
MDRRHFIAGAAVILPVIGRAQTTATVAPQTASLRDRVLGAWRIVDAETVNAKTGATRPWLGRPRPYSGMIVYLANGCMSVQIGAARPPTRADAGFGALSEKEKAAYADTWYAYYGRFEIDEAQSQVRHFLEGSLFGFETGKTYVRNVRLENGVLALQTELETGPEGDTFNRLTWTRI